VNVTPRNALGRQLVVLAVNGVGPAAIRAMGRYLDTRLLCR
jgi:hypothetical protein